MDGIDVRLLAIVAGASLVGLLVYFLPLFVAIGRGHRNATAIGVLLLLLGWSFVPWVIALVWAFTVGDSAANSDQLPAPTAARRGNGWRVAGAIALVVLLPAGLIGLIAALIVAGSPTPSVLSAVREMEAESRAAIPLEAELARIDHQLEELRFETQRLTQELAHATVARETTEDTEVRERAQTRAELLSAQIELLRTTTDELEAKRARIAEESTIVRDDETGASRYETSDESLERLRTSLDDLEYELDEQKAMLDLSKRQELDH